MSVADCLYSVRMNASAPAAAGSDAGRRHVSGGERLVPREQVENVVAELTVRAFQDGRSAEAVRISVDAVDPATVVTIPALPVTTVDAPATEESIDIALVLLAEAGVAKGRSEAGFELLRNGPVLPGAAVFGASGERLDPDNRGVRVSRLDYTRAARDWIAGELATGRIPHPRTVDALAIASKVIWGGAVAEICWSDDDYEAGYVATRRRGYVRLPNFKPVGSAGGRVFFTTWTQGEAARRIEVLRAIPTLIELPIEIKGPIPYRQFASGAQI